MTNNARKQLLRTGFFLVVLGLIPVAPRIAHAGLAALDAFHVGRYHLANGEREKALESFNDALRLNPQFVQAYVARGKLYAELGQHESALVDLNFALRLQPTHAEAFAYRGYALLALGQPQKALPDLDMALRMDPSYARVYFLRGQAMQMLGDEQNAAQSIALARRLDPTLEISQTIAASNDGSIHDGGVQLAGGSSPQRTPIMTDLLAETTVAKPVDPKSQGRLVPFQMLPALTDVAPPAMSQKRESVFSGAPQMLNHGRHQPAPLQTMPQFEATAGAVIPDITSDEPAPAMPTAPQLAEEIAAVAKTENDAPSETAAKAEQKSTDEAPAAVKPESAVPVVVAAPAPESAAPIVVAAPAPESAAPVVVAAPAPANAEVKKLLESDSQQAVAADISVTPAPIEALAPPAKPIPQLVLPTETAPPSENPSVVSHGAGDTIPAFGPRIFVPRGALAADDLPSVRPASEILRGSLSEALVLPEKPSSVDGDKRLAAAVASARQAVALDAPMAFAGDEGAAGQPEPATPEVSAEQREQAAAAFRRGMQCEAEGNAAGALAAYRESLECDPTDAQVFCRRGHLLLEGFRTAEALADFEQAVKLAPGLSNGYFGRAHVRYETQQYLDAIDDYSIALRLDDQHAQSLLERGHCHFLLGDMSRAKADRQAALDLDPALAKSEPKYAVDSSPSPAVRGQIMPGATAFVGDDGVVPAAASASAADVVNGNAIATDEPSAPTEKQETSAFNELFTSPASPSNESPEALAPVQELGTPEKLEEVPAAPEGDKQSLEAEVQRLSEELSQFPGDRDRYFRRARAYCRLGRNEAALEDLHLALRLDPQSVELLTFRAGLNLHTERFAAAHADYNELVRLNPNDANILLCRARGAAECGESEAALADLNQAVALNPQLAAAYLERSRIYAERGDFAQSQADRRCAMSLDAASR